MRQKQVKQDLGIEKQLVTEMLRQAKEIEIPQIVLERADASYAQIRHQAAQEKCMAVRCKDERMPTGAAGILLAVVILSATAVSAATVGIVGYRRYMAERMTDIGTDEFVKWPWVIKHYREGKWAKNITREEV